MGGAVRTASLSTGPLAVGERAVIVSVKAARAGGEVLVKVIGQPTTEKRTLAEVAEWILEQRGNR